MASSPPIAPRHLHTTTIHEHTMQDAYYWLRERQNPAVRAYLEAENTFLAQNIPTATQSVFVSELQSRIVGDSENAATRIGAYTYTTKYEDESDYPVIVRQSVHDGSTQIVCDVQHEARGHAFLKLGTWKVSPDGAYVALLFDTSGNEHFTLHIRRIADGQAQIIPVANLYYGVAWSPDSQYLYLVQPDEAWRPSRVLRWQWRTPFAEAHLLFHEPNELCNVVMRASGDARHILIGSHSSTTSEVWVYDADTGACITSVAPRHAQVEYDAQLIGDHIYLQTNDHAVNFCIQSRPLGGGEWRTVVPHREDTVIESMQSFAEHLVLWVRRGGLPHIEILALADASLHVVSFPDATYSIAPWWHQEYHGTLLRFSYATPITPTITYDYDMQSRKLHRIKQDPTAGPPHHPEHYRLERVTVASHDGTKVPLTIIRHQSVACDGTAPTLLIGYGAYGANLGVGFVAERLSLLERGWIIALAHIRGGGEMGRTWYLDGKLLHKQNTFTDFIACAEFLVAQRYTQPSRLACFGRSAGGLLMGAVVTQRPDLFAACIAGVPFVDVINTMLDRSIPLTVPEYEEWGNPYDPEYFAYMYRYSPYDQSTAQQYPAILMTAGFNDPRVQYWEPAKWIAKLRHLTPTGTYYLYTDFEAGHAGKSGRYDAVSDRALEYAFLCDILGVSVHTTIHSSAQQ